MGEMSSKNIAINHGRHSERERSWSLPYSLLPEFVQTKIRPPQVLRPFPRNGDTQKRLHSLQDRAAHEFSGPTLQFLRSSLTGTLHISYFLSPPGYSSMTSPDKSISRTSPGDMFRSTKRSKEPHWNGENVGCAYGELLGQINYLLELGLRDVASIKGDASLSGHRLFGTVCQALHTGLQCQAWKDTGPRCWVSGFGCHRLDVRS